MTVRPGGDARRPAPAGPVALGGASAPAGAPPAPEVARPLAPVDEVRGARHERLRQLRRSRTLVAGTVIVCFWILCAAFGPHIAPHDPLATDPLNALAGPSGDHWFGTDRLGRDSFARVMAGGREILILAPAAALVATVVGTALGLVAGYLRASSTTFSPGCSKRF